MIIACPECQGKLSTVAPTCPHCGFVQRPATPPAPPPASESAPQELLPPSRSLLQDAAKKEWRRWQHDNFWSLVFGALAVLGVLGVLALVIRYCSRLTLGR